MNRRTVPQPAGSSGWLCEYRWPAQPARKAVLAVALLPFLVCVAAVFGQVGHVGMRPARFAAVDVFVDSGADKLAAWQVEFVGTAKGGAVELVGVEGGAAGAFEKPAYFDPEALAHNRVILAAYALGADLPTGKTRIARLHLRVTGENEPEYSVQVMKAASGGGDGGREITGSVRASTAQGDR